MPGWAFLMEKNGRGLDVLSELRREGGNGIQDAFEMFALEARKI